MVIPGDGAPSFDRRYISGLIVLVFALGTLTLVAFVVSLFILCLYVLHLALNAVIEIVAALSSLYAGGDSIVKLVFWLVLFFTLYKVSPVIAGRLRRAFHLV